MSPMILNYLLASIVAGTSATPTVASASIRTRIGAGAGVSGANFVRTARFQEKAIVPVSDPWIEYAAAYVNTALTTAAHEVATTNATPVAGAFLTGISGTGQNQSGATLTPVTWFNAANGVAGYVGLVVGVSSIVYKTAAEFTAAGGSISGDGITITVPGGWWVRCDSATGLTLSGAYCIQWESSAPQGQQYVSTVSGRTNLCDYGKDSTARSGLLIKDWTTLTGVGSGSINASPCAVYGINAQGKKTIGVDGDSIANDNFDRDASGLYGDAEGSFGFIGRALNAAGYPMVRTAISGEAATPINAYGGWALRKHQLRYAHAIITDMGHNDRGYSWATLQPILRAHWTRLRQAGVGGNARVIATTWFPQANSTDNWATTANQTSTTGPGTMQYDSYNPFIVAGNFNTGLGDPDAGYDAYAALYAGAAAAGATDVVATKWPANGTAKAYANDLTHPANLTHAYVGADLAPKLPAILGFSA